MEQLRRLVVQLRGDMAAKDAALLKSAQQVSDLQQVVAGLQTRNEELAMKSANLSEADFESVRSEFESRLAAAERKVGCGAGAGVAGGGSGDGETGSWRNRGRLRGCGCGVAVWRCRRGGLL